DEQAIRTVLGDQVAAWNRGDIDGFMEGYWRSDALQFRTPERVFTGWHATRDRYKAKYSTREKMGTLDFLDLAITRAEKNHAIVTGRYRLRRAAGAPDTGRFKLDFRFIRGCWRIVRDETEADSLDR
ncbi:MAG TPA: DUF4440 domain-containing protein, partial [Phycisphaerae bacterium]|nr:DUF4440 domain-containing protein [Phycisphaerae bacterium]